MPDMAILLLVGGKSSRMGKEKAKVLWEGKTLLKHQLQLLEQLDSEIFLSINPHQTDEFRAYSCITDEYLEIGPMGGIVSALKLLQKDLLVVPIDMPLLTLNLLESLSIRRLKSCYLVEGRIAPFPSYWTLSLIPSLLENIEKGEFSVARFIEKNDFELIKTDQVTAFRNMNAPSDLI
jgi:molybdopterin-guanine dinucleotide biosynthesis protein A